MIKILTPPGNPETLADRRLNGVASYLRDLPPDLDLSLLRFCDCGLQTVHGSRFYVDEWSHDPNDEGRWRLNPLDADQLAAIRDWLWVPPKKEE